MPGKPEVQPQTLFPANQATRFFFEKLKLVLNAKVASLDTIIILKETSSATDSVITISRTATYLILS